MKDDLELAGASTERITRRGAHPSGGCQADNVFWWRRGHSRGNVNKLTTQFRQTAPLPGYGHRSMRFDTMWREI